MAWDDNAGSDPPPEWDRATPPGGAHRPPHEGDARFHEVFTDLWLALAVEGTVPGPHPGDLRDRPDPLPPLTPADLVPHLRALAEELRRGAPPGDAAPP